MILSQAETRRLFRILDPLTDYANLRLDVLPHRDLHPMGSSHMDKDAQGRVLRELWENLYVFDEFVQRNPAALSDMELRAANDMRTGGVKGLFFLDVYPDGRLLFLDESHLFEVSGISKEIRDMVTRTPTFVDAMIVPFENRIVYTEVMVERPFELADDVLKTFRDDARAAFRDGRIVTTAQELLDIAPNLRDKKADREVEQLRSDLEEEAELARDNGNGWHRGALSGLSEEEREAAIRSNDATFNAELQKNLVPLLEKKCTSGEPTDDLVELIRREDPDVIKRLTDSYREIEINELTIQAIDGALEEWHASGGTTKLPKPEDVRAKLPADNRPVAEQLGDYLIKPDNMHDTLRLLSLDELLALKKLCKSGGRMEVAVGDITGVRDLPRCMPGLCHMFRTASGFLYVMPAQIHASLSEADLDNAIEDAQRDLSEVDFVNSITELRGIVPLNEAVCEWLGLQGIPGFSLDMADRIGELSDDEEDLVADTAIRLCDRAVHRMAGFDVLDTGDELFLLCWQIGDQMRYELGLDADLPEDRDPFISAALEGSAQRIFSEASRKAPRPLEPEMLADGVYDWKLRIPAVRAMRNFLDAHVPDERNDLYFADKVIEELVDEMAWGATTDALENYFGILEDNDYIPEKAHLNRLINLLMNMANSLPIWANNGWSPNELLEEETGVKRFFNDDGSPMKVGRNDPCPCGSGKKYKKCHGKTW